ncbi:MAG: hypothetical protein ACRCXY_10930 [Fusobacteriaceae bacterium]
MEIFGITKKQYLALKFLSDINKELFKKHYNNNSFSINSKIGVIAYLKNEIGFESREYFFIIYLESANHIINDKELKPASFIQRNYRLLKELIDVTLLLTIPLML